MRDTCLRILILHVHRQTVGRQRTGRVTRVNTCLFDMLHDGANHHFLAVTDQIDIDLDGRIQEVIQQHRAVIADFDRLRI
jgi:hypothetical protein